MRYGFISITKGDLLMRVMLLVNPKNFIGKTLAYHGYTGEIKYNLVEFFESE